MAAFSWPTVRLGLLTSLCGFGALVFSGFPGLAQLGVFSIAGLVAAAFGTRYVFPILSPDGAPGMGLRRQLGRVAELAARGLPCCAGRCGSSHWRDRRDRSC
jgi:predicted exporter